MSEDLSDYKQEGKLYKIDINEKGHQYIECKKCGRKSYHPQDIANKYCGSCNIFLQSPMELAQHDAEQTAKFYEKWIKG